MQESGCCDPLWAIGCNVSPDHNGNLRINEVRDVEKTMVRSTIVELWKWLLNRNLTKNPMKVHSSTRDLCPTAMLGIYTVQGVISRPAEDPELVTIRRRVGQTGSFVLQN